EEICIHFMDIYGKSAKKDGVLCGENSMCPEIFHLPTRRVGGQPLIKLQVVI
ncbi:hypothetical protein CHS0354_034392, partial [Potamilus streckersoni]